MTPLRPLLGALAAALAVLAGPAWGQAEDDSGLVQARAAIDQRLAAEEAACYQKFAVTDCLRRARRQARSERAALQQRESAAKAEIRRARSEQSRQALQDKQAAAASAAAQREPQAEPKAGRRAGPTAPRAPRQAVGKRAKPIDTGQRTEEAARAHERQIEKQRAAAERAKAQQQRDAERAAQGRPRAAPLPDPS